MVYNIGDLIVLRVYSNWAVGRVISKTKIRNSNAYDVKLEDGRLIENCSLNKEIANGFLINKKLTQMFNEKHNPAPTKETSEITE
jgi:hypothetical protein